MRSKPVVILWMLAAVVGLSACGIKGNLVRPSEIPALEKKREERLRKLEIDEQKEPQA